MSRGKEFGAGWTIICVVSILLVTASLTECTSDTNVSIVVTTPGEMVNASSTILLVCVAHGSPTPSIGWELGDTAITNCTSERHTVYEREITAGINTTFKESILEICSAEPEDSGEYLCTASNGVSSVSATNPTNLTVIPEPSTVAIVVTTPSETVNSGSTVLFVCVAYGSPEAPSINWQLNGTTITNSTSCQHTIFERTIKTSQSNYYFTESILQVCNAGIVDSGEYLCTASVGNTTAEATNATVLTVLNEAPPQPENCSSVPVYNEEGALISINFTWSRVNVSEEVSVGSVNDLNITHYTVSFDGLGAHRLIPAETVCQNKAAAGYCSYSYALQSFNLPNGLVFAGQVAAENTTGQGRACLLSVEPQNSGQVNSFLTLSDSTTANTKMVECSLQGTTGAGQSCEFCYSLGRSCLQSTTCEDVAPGATVELPVLAEGTYCYRARALVNGRPTVIIQDTFNIRSCPNTGLASGTGQSTILSLPVTASVSAVIALIVGLLIGCLFGTISVYLCTRRGKPAAVHKANDETEFITNSSAVAMSSGLTMPTDTGENAITRKDLFTNDAYVSTKVDDAPQYEDVEKYQQPHYENKNKNEFELSENNAYCRAEDFTDGVYDNGVYDNTD